MENLKSNKNLTLSFTNSIQGNKLIVIYQNVRSLKKNLNHIINDCWYYQTDVLIFSETYSINSDNFQIDGYTIIYRSDNNQNFKKGIICFVKKDTKSEIINSITIHIKMDIYIISIWFS